MANMNHTNRKMNTLRPDKNTMLNHEGAVVHKLNKLEELFSRANGSYLGENTYYEKENSAEREFNEIRDIVASLSDADAEYALKIAAIAREGNMVSTPLAILTACYNDDKFKGANFADENGKSKMSGYTAQIIRRGRDITDILAFQLEGYGRDRAIPKQERKQLKRMLETFDSYQLSKALGKNRSVSLADAVKLIRPSKNTEFFKQVIEGKVKFGNGKAQVQTALAAKESKAEDVVASLKDSSLMAIVKNLVAMSRRDALTDEATAVICEKLTNAETVRRSRILPYQLYDAYKSISHLVGANANAIKDALVEAIDLSVDNVSAIEGYTAFFVDLSGSMSAPVSGMSSTDAMEVAAVLAAIAAKKSNSRVYAFADNVQEVSVSKKSTVVDIVRHILHDTRVGGGTKLMSALKTVAESGEKFDNVVILSDNDCYTYNDKVLTLGGWYDSYGYARHGVRKSCDDFTSELIANGTMKRFFVNNLTSRNFAIVNTDDYRKNLVTGFSERYIDEINGTIAIAKNAGNIINLIDYLYDLYFGKGGKSKFAMR